MTMLSEAKLVVLDVETTGLSPAMGDRVIELGMIACRGATEISRSSHLINPGRPIPWDAQRVHGISDHDVSECPPFKEIAGEVGSILVDYWVVGHNVRFDTGFIAVVTRARLAHNHLDANADLAGPSVFAKEKVMHSGEVASVWSKKGATLSDKSARKEFGLTQEEIIEAINEGKLQYRENCVFGNPYFKLIRSEVETLVAENHGSNYLKKRKAKNELAQVNKELKILKAQVAFLEDRKVELSASLGK
ncbi:MAG: 3'-5' exonuclease [Planctomycetes bacterium]|nr:3'-5' exonuclease [Planctomycetota bacterium]